MTLLAPPFSADVLREGLPDGTRITFETTRDGQATRSDWVFRDGGPQTVTVEMADPAGSRVVTFGWAELAGHATFPAAHTVRTEGEVQSDVGVFPGWTYVVADPAEGTESTFLFARPLPGPPIRMTVRQGEQTLVDMRMLLRLPPGSVPPEP